MIYIFTNATYSQLQETLIKWSFLLLTGDNELVGSYGNCVPEDGEDTYNRLPFSLKSSLIRAPDPIEESIKKLNSDYNNRRKCTLVIMHTITRDIENYLSPFMFCKLVSIAFSLQKFTSVLKRLSGFLNYENNICRMFSKLKILFGISSCQYIIN